MSRSARTLYACLISAAILAGPLAARCAACCPQSETQRAVVAPLGCCGDCGTKLERLPDPAFVAAKAFVGPDLLVIRASTPQIPAGCAFEPTVTAGFSDYSASRAPQAPLRL